MQVVVELVTSCAQNVVVEVMLDVLLCKVQTCIMLHHVWYFVFIQEILFVVSNSSKLFFSKFLQEFFISFRVINIQEILYCTSK